MFLGLVPVEGTVRCTTLFEGDLFPRLFCAVYVGGDMGRIANRTIVIGVQVVQGRSCCSGFLEQVSAQLLYGHAVKLCYHVGACILFDA